jgi:MSHA biogenesis protein MshL
MCPDGGLVVVGGFKAIRDVDRESTTPIIGDIPILGNLFKRKGRSLENRSLIVILKAEVTDLLEQEERMP